MPTAAQLRQQFPIFTYRSSAWQVVADKFECTFTYVVADRVCTHSVVYHEISPARVKKLPQELIDRVVLNLGMITAFSYWKATASPRFVIEAGFFTVDQIKWWHDLLIAGMGEFFFVNDLDFTQTSFVTMEVHGQPVPPVAARSGVESTTASGASTADSAELALSKHFLIPVGGGKDSAVTLELLTEFLKQESRGDLPKQEQVLDGVGTVLFQAPEAAAHMAKLSGLAETIIIDRTFDKQLTELNEQGYLNGHTPFSAMLAFVTTLAAVLHGYQNIVLSNERSANEGNILFHGSEINHQFSKTYSFETAFREYLATSLFSEYEAGTYPEYFSFLRPLFELQIAAHFAKIPKYHRDFRSCNRGQKTNSWCGNCSKCLFAYLILFPFFPWDRLQALFGKDLFADLSLQRDAGELLGVGAKKPLECVGTHAECRVAVGLSLERYQALSLPLPPLLEWMSNQLSYFSDQERLEERHAILSGWGTEHAVPKQLAQELHTRTVHAVSELPLSKLSDKHIVIFGTGREGNSTAAFLHRNLPSTQVVLCDEAAETNISAQQVLHPSQISVTDQTVVFKTPGIPTSHPTLQKWLSEGANLYSNTQLFFELVQSYTRTFSAEICTIGVTGTKGKSTTTSMIAHLLETAGKPVLLGGNIGVPPLELWEAVLKHCTEKPQEQLFVVLELSAHQLADVTISPNFAVVQDITPEHLDYYPDFATYRTAKTQIVAHQSAHDHVFYNPTLTAPSVVAEATPATRHHFALSDNSQLCCYVVSDCIMSGNDVVLPLAELPLRGTHNILNIMPSVCIAQQLGIPLSTVQTALRSFQPLPHRLQFVKELNGVSYYNDSLATTPEAAVQAITSFAPRPIVLIAGGTDRNLDFSILASCIASNSVVGTVLFPPTGKTLGKLLEAAAPACLQQHVSTMSEAVTAAAAIIAQAELPSDTHPVVLLSPGSASFGIFRDYADRGNQFIQAVQAL